MLSSWQILWPSQFPWTSNKKAHTGSARESGAPGPQILPGEKSLHHSGRESDSGQQGRGTEAQMAGKTQGQGNWHNSRAHMPMSSASVHSCLSRPPTWRRLGHSIPGNSPPAMVSLLCKPLPKDLQDPPQLLVHLPRNPRKWLRCDTSPIYSPTGLQGP